MPKHTVRVPAALWDEWQPRLSPEDWPLPILAMLAASGSQSLEEITKALQVTKFEALGATQRACDFKADQRAPPSGSPDVPAARGEGGVKIP